MAKYIFHGAGKVKKRGKTRDVRFTMVLVKPGVEASNLLVGLAVCDSTDNFSREKGRQIALDRAMSSRPTKQWKVTPTATKKDILEIGYKEVEKISNSINKYKQLICKRHPKDASI